MSQAIKELWQRVAAFLWHVIDAPETAPETREAAEELLEDVLEQMIFTPADARAIGKHVRESAGNPNFVPGNRFGVPPGS